MPRSALPLPALLLAVAASCGPVSHAGNASSLAAAFHGYSPALAAATVELEVHVGGSIHRWSGPHAARVGEAARFPPVPVRSGDQVTEVAVLRDATGRELVRARSGFTAEGRTVYEVGVQVGGQNPARRSFCIDRPRALAVPGFPGDTLFLWESGRPEGVAC